MNIDELKIFPSNTLKESMKKLQITSRKCLFVVDENSKLLGALTDGDIRRSLLDGSEVNSTIEKYYSKNPLSYSKNNYSVNEVVKVMNKQKLYIIPIVDRNNYLIDYIDYNLATKGKKFLKKKLSNVSVVIMAGGKGSRLDPFTKILPKPLLPLNDKPVIEHIIDNFREYSINTFYLTLNYKNQLIKAYFDELAPSYHLKYIEEKKPLGTFGGLGFLKKNLKRPFFLSNCDILIKDDYHEIYNYHKKKKNDVTIIASVKNYNIPYGVCEVDTKGTLKKIVEKPKFNFLANTGFYIINPDVLKDIKTNIHLDFNNFVTRLIKRKKKIGVFPVMDENWIDIGEWPSYQKALGKFEK